MDAAERHRLLAVLPQARPFRFVDDLLEIDREHADLSVA